MVFTGIVKLSEANIIEKRNRPTLTETRRGRLMVLRVVLTKTSNYSFDEKFANLDGVGFSSFFSSNTVQTIFKVVKKEVARKCEFHEFSFLF